MAKGVIPASDTGSKKAPSCFLCCCGASLVLDLDESEAASVDPTVGRSSGVRRLRFRQQEEKLEKKGKTRSTAEADIDTAGSRDRLLPEAAAAGDPATGKEEAIISKRKPERKNFSQKFPMDPSNQEDNQATKRVQIASVHHITSKSKIQSKPVPLYRVHHQTQIGTLESHPGSPEPRHKKSSSKHANSFNRESSSNFDPKSNFIYGLSIIALILELLIFCDRTFTIVCMCAWFYLLPRIRRSSVSIDTKVGRRRSVEQVDTSSEEYKKMVVLKGLLERDGRRTMRSNVAR